MGEALLPLSCPGAIVASDVVPNPHNPAQKDRIETTECSWARAKVYISTSASNAAGLPISLEVTRPTDKLPRFMNVGEPIDGVVERFGPPSTRTGGDYVYVTDQESDESVSFKMAGDRIGLIVWSWYLD